MSKRWYPHGVVFSGKGATESPVHIDAIPAAPRIAAFVDCYWSMEWNCGEEVVPFLVVPSGCVNLIWQDGSARLIGVRTRAHPMEMRGQGRYFGVRFTAGGYYAFSGQDVAETRDRTIPIDVARLPAPEPAALDAWLAARLPAEPDEDLRRITRAVEICAEESVFTSADLLARLPGTTERGLQRLFQRYLGLTPRHWIRTRRFQSVADRIVSGERIDWTALADELGYFDQAHFINDFRTVTGTTPARLSESSNTTIQTSTYNGSHKEVP